MLMFLMSHAQELHQIDKRSLEKDGFEKTKTAAVGVQRQFETKRELIEFFSKYRISYDEMPYEKKSQTLFSKRKTFNVRDCWFGVEESYEEGLVDGNPNQKKKVKYIVTAVLGKTTIPPTNNPKAPDEGEDGK